MPTVNFTHSNTPPDGVPRASQTPNNTAPGGVTLASMAGTAAQPVGVTLSGLTHNDGAPAGVPRASQTPNNTAPGVVPLTGMAPSNAEADGTTLPNFTPDDTPAAPISLDGSVPSLPNMPATFQPAFVELTGAGPSLATLTASVADIGKIIQGTVNGELKSYQVRAGTDAQALPGIVRPLNFNADTNAVVFVQL